MKPSLGRSAVAVGLALTMFATFAAPDTTQSTTAAGPDLRLRSNEGHLAWRSWRGAATLPQG